MMTSPLVHFGREICGNLTAANQREWYLSNGLGAFACGSLSGCLTRRYHGLLVAPLKQPLDRHLLMAKADATLWIDDQAVPLFSNHWQGDVVAPNGYVHIESFYLEGRLPVWVFSVQGVRLEYRIWMTQDAHMTWVGVRVLDQGAAQKLAISWDLIVNCRDYHSQMSSGGLSADLSQPNKQNLTVKYQNAHHLSIRTSHGEIIQDNTWINHFFLEKEQERGLATLDNHLKVGQARISLSTTRDWAGICCALGHGNDEDINRSLLNAQAYQQQLLQRALPLSAKQTLPTAIQSLILSADSFIFQRPLATGKAGESIIAGYPWFGDWGRDSMIALPGLTLVTGRAAIAKQILLTYAHYIDRGMLPNLFPETSNQAEYNTVDAALWYIMACYYTFRMTQDTAMLKALLPALQQIVTHYQQGTRYGIQMDTDGLIMAGEQGYQLTWMDAKIGDWVVTPRYGKPVEVNALWYNALQVMVQFSKILNDPQQAHYQALAEQTLIGFQKFLTPDGWLYDCIDEKDASIRPNQLFAICLPWACVKPDAAKTILACLKRHLLTSYGLRSLSPTDPAYRGIYQGDVMQRDSAYHQGTVWGWLLGHFAVAEYRVNRDKNKALGYLLPMINHLTDAGLGSISEIFDGDAPHKARGAPAQAWSVACTLEAWWRIEHGKINE